MPRVALVVPYFPPDAGGGVFRALKLAPLLAGYGWEAEVFTVENPGLATDPTLLDEVPPHLPVTRVPAGAAQRLQRGPLRKLGFAFEALGLTASAMAQWDQLAEAVVETHRRRPFDVLFSTSPPAAAHRAVLAVLDHLAPLARPAWVADFRDPWRRSFTYRPASDAEAAADVRDEGRTLYGATVITATVYASMLASCMEHSLSGEKLTWIPNGYDPRDVEGLSPTPLPPSPPTRTDPFRFGYAGSLYGAYNLDLFLEALGRVLEARPDLDGAVTLELFGPRTKQPLERIKRDHLRRAVQVRGYVPHRQALQELAHCHWVLVTMPQDPRAQDTVPGKLYEYLGARFPVLAFASPDGAIAKLLYQTEGGLLVSAQDPDAVAEQLVVLLRGNGGLPALPPPPPAFAAFQHDYSRQEVARRFAAAFDRALAQHRP
ncbi:MAG TPA: glycosyltransferase [bacterium]|nr:glycosyltransferase [bacterium]